MQNSPEQTPDQMEVTGSGTERQSKSLGGKRSLLAVAAILAATAGCTSDTKETPTASTSGDTFSSSGQGGNQGEKAPKGISAAEYLAKRCNQSMIGKADNSGYNGEFAVVDDGDHQDVVEICAQGGAKEVRVKINKCGSHNDIYVPTTDVRHAGQDVAYVALGDPKDPARSWVTVGSKIRFDKEGLPNLSYVSRDGQYKTLPGSASMTVGTLVDKPVCGAVEKPAAVRVAVAQKPRENLATAEQLAKIDQRLSGVETRLGTVEQQQQDAAKQLAEVLGRANLKPGTCVDYATTPGECRRLEQAGHVVNSDTEQARHGKEK
jgi:hypothetical protein